uniref:Uncharacterized protein n=1 Tax=Pyramimonas obovata TaxID=1411642 RepID=A0A7S0WR57_9CHLO|eukprot:CAMPEP_0118920870 /NCGR_PEP_ID=MMETSP1169-20130426/301_1 /TAXON_ID=36882 /ORGANISM="Pyramimonas obovata, Strain CCMP722" /LENGTH=268 /DNA_ID=CAMNT_0006861487 /DNA_START=86 /DNA_END=892 /DNA_ORIENTATION=-
MGGTYSKVKGVPDLAKNPRITMGMGRNMMRKKAGKATAVGDPTVEITHDGVVAKEAGGWKAKGEDAWKSFQAARPYSLEGYQVKAPKAGDMAPDGTVHPREAGDPTTLLATVKALAQKSGMDDVAVIFGCSTCPAFRVFGGYDFHQAFKKKALPVLYVYTREAHGHDDFESAMNLTNPFALTKTINMHKNLEERRAAATLLYGHTVTQHGGKEHINMVLDDLDDGLEKKYEARPFRAYVITASTGQVKYASGVCPFNMEAKMLNIAKL